jgi:hypothetical protein
MGLQRVGERRCPPLWDAIYSLKEIVSSLAVISTSLQATFLESGGQIRKDTDRSGQVFRPILYRHEQP